MQERRRRLESMFARANPHLPALRPDLDLGWGWGTLALLLGMSLSLAAVMGAWRPSSASGAKGHPAQASPTLPASGTASVTPTLRVSATPSPSREPDQQASPSPSPSPEPSPTNELCPPNRIYLPIHERTRGVGHIPPLLPSPTLDLRQPCPPQLTPGPTSPIETATPSQTPTATQTGTIPPSATPSATATPSPTATLTPSATPLPLDGLFGVQVFEADLQPLADGIFDEAGAGWIRLRALWRGIEWQDQETPDYRWGTTDTMISVANQRNLRPIVVVYDKPDWAASTRCGPVDRVPLERYERFLTDLVERYDGDGTDDAPGSPRVGHWEIGNEPDFTPSQAGSEGDYGSCFGDDPEAYAEQLRAAHRAIRSADPSAQVVFGAVAYDRFFDAPGPEFQPSGPFRYDFVKQVLTTLHERYGEEPDWPYFDTMGFHNYNDFRNHWDGPDGSQPEIIGKAGHLREAQMQLEGAFDLRSHPLLASELGMPSAPGDNFTERSEAYQAGYMAQVMSRAAAAGLTAAIWYTASDLETGPCDQIYEWLTHGLLRTRWVAEAAAACEDSPLPGYTAAQDFDPKPSLAAFKAANALLAGARYDRQLRQDETLVPGIEVHRFELRDGRAAMVAFTDHGERLGRRGSTDLNLPLSIGPRILPGWTGQVEIIDHLGNRREELGSRIELVVGYAPQYVVVLP